MKRPRITYRITLQRTSTNYTTSLMTNRHLKHRNLIVNLAMKETKDYIAEEVQKVFRSNKLLAEYA